MESTTPPAGDDARRRTILVIWSGMTLSVLFYCFLCYTIAQGPGRRNLTDHLVGPMQYFPYLLPVLLLGIGWNAYNAVALRNAKPGHTRWGAVQTGLVIMLAASELNVVIGLVFFFLGSPLDKFLLFAVGTLVLNALILRRVIETWPRS